MTYEYITKSFNKACFPRSQEEHVLHVANGTCHCIAGAYIIVEILHNHLSPKTVVLFHSVFIALDPVTLHVFCYMCVHLVLNVTGLAPVLATNKS